MKRTYDKELFIENWVHISHNKGESVLLETPDLHVGISKEDALALIELLNNAYDL
jgi:hypothetical protein